MGRAIRILFDAGDVLTRQFLSFLLLVGVAVIFELLSLIAVRSAHGAEWSVAAAFLADIVSSTLVVTGAAFLVWSDVGGETPSVKKVVDAVRARWTRAIAVVAILGLFTGAIELAFGLAEPTARLDGDPNAAVALASAGAFVLLIVAVFVVLIRLSVAPIAAVIEDLGPIDSFKRSLALTRGWFWPLVGVVVLPLVAMLVVLGLLTAIVANAAPTLIAPAGMVLGAVIGVFGAVAVALIFLRLTDAEAARRTS